MLNFVKNDYAVKKHLGEYKKLNNKIKNEENELNKEFYIFQKNEIETKIIWRINYLIKKFKVENEFFLNLS